MNLNRIIAIAFSLCCVPSVAQESAVPIEKIFTVHAKTLPKGAPSSDLLLVGHVYALSLNAETKVATWCAYRATEHDGASRNVLSRNWLHALPDATLEESDFRGPEYDIGHLAPLATFKASVYAFELNFLGNCAPQTPNLNRGPWLELEQLVRDLAENVDHVDVVVGPLYERDMHPLPAADEAHTVPSHYWAVIAPKGLNPRAFIVDQACDRSDEAQSFSASVDEIERRSGLTFPRKRR